MTHGGKRPGSGRKPIGHVRMTVYISADAAERVKRLAEQTGATLGEVIEQVIMGRLQSPRPVARVRSA